MRLDLEAARAALETDVAEPLGLGLEEAAAAVLALATEKMVGAIEEITINQGIDPQTRGAGRRRRRGRPERGRGRPAARLRRAS